MKRKVLAVAAAVCGLLALSVLACQGSDGMRDRVARDEEDPAPWLREVLAAEVRLAEPGPPAAEQLSRLLQRTASLPGVQEVAVVDVLPGAIALRHQIKIQHEGSPSHQQEAGYLQVVSPGYFAVMKLPLRQGRFFSQGDLAQSPPVAIVNESYARQSQHSGKNMLGERMRIAWPTGPWLTIVGIVQDGPRAGSIPEVYVPYAQNAVYGPPPDSWYLLVRPAGDGKAVADSLRRVQGMELRTLEERLKAHMEVYQLDLR